MEKNVLAKF